MKKIYILILINLFFITANKAQGYIPQSVQLVHNSADVSIPALKIWLNDTVWVSSLSFQQATAKKTFASGVYTLGVSLPTATAQSQSIAQQTFELGATTGTMQTIDSQFLTINGIVGDATHPLVITARPMGIYGLPSPFGAYFTFHNGCTSYNAVNISITPTVMPNPGSTLNNLAYTDAGRQDLSFDAMSASNNVFTVNVNAGATLVGSFLLPLANYLQKDVNIVMNSSFNLVQKISSTGFGLAIVPASGGSVTPLSKIETPNGINTLSGNTVNVTLAPNPVNNLLTVSLNEPSNGLVSLQVMDIAGHIVIEQKSLQASENTMDVKQLSQGIYFLTITQGQAHKTVKFVKN